MTPRARSKPSLEASASKARRLRDLRCRIDEFERLREVGFRERWLYLELKVLSRTSQRLTYENLAAAMNHAASLGLTSEWIDANTARRLLNHLETAGLVFTRWASGDDAGLHISLPMSSKV